MVPEKCFEEKKALFSDFLVRVEQMLCSDLENERSCFPSCGRLLGKFKNYRSSFDTEANVLSSERLDRFIREAMELVNEMCVAKKILTASSKEVTCLRYEPPLPCTCLTIDFRSVASDGSITWWDVKTIHPEEKDAWGKYEEHVRRELFPEQVELTLIKNGRFS